jgi:hypothetical protein
LSKEAALALYRIICEYDIGQEGVVFTSENAALDWAAPALASAGSEETLGQLQAEGLFELTEITVVGTRNSPLTPIGWISLIADKRTGALRQRTSGGSSTRPSRKVYQSRGIAARYGLPAEAFACLPQPEAAQ